MTSSALYGGLHPHPLADVFPLMEGREYEELRDSIGRNGLRHAITMHEGMILDGRNRKRACVELGIVCKEVDFYGEDPIEYVFDVNIARRQLSTSQRSIAAARLVTAKRGGYRGERVMPPADDEIDNEMTVKKAAEHTKVSVRSVRAGRRILRDGIPEVARAVERGDMAVKTAERVAALDHDEQRKIMSLPAKDIIKAVSPRPPVPIPVAEFSDGPALKPMRAIAERSRSPGPRYQLERQMGLRELHMVQRLVEDWRENQESIGDLDPERLREFVYQLKGSRKAMTQLIKIIEENTTKTTKEDRPW